MLREDIGLTGTKVACGEGHCGACTVMLDGVPTLSCITLVHTVDGREVTTIEGLRDHPLVHAFVRSDAVQCGFCTPGQIVSAAALVAANPSPVEGRDPACDVREPLPLRDVSQDRGGHQHLARLIRTEKEVEGRYEDVWIVVDEDALDQWPEGPAHDCRPRAPARRRSATGARTGAVHRRPPASGDAAYGRAAQPARAGACREHRPRRRTSRRRACARSSAPASSTCSSEDPGYVGQAVAAVAAETFGQARRALEQLNVNGRCSSRCSTQTRRCGKSPSCRTSRPTSAATFEHALAEADAVVEAEYRTQVVLHNSMETHQSVCHWEDDGITIYISTQYIWGVRDAMAAHLGLPPDKVRVVCQAMGGGFGSKNGPGDYTPIAAELAKRTGRPVKCALTRREENIAAGNRNATIQRLTAAAKADGTLVALGGDFVNAIGFSGWSRHRRKAR